MNTIIKLNGIRNYLIFGLISAFLISCTVVEQDKKPDLSGIEIEVEVKRFEKALFGLDTNNFEQELEQLKVDFPLFSKLYFDQILGAPSKKSENLNYIKGFVQFPEVQNLYGTCMELYDDFSEVEEALELAFRYYKYYFPDRNTPKLTTYISEYSVGAFIYGDDELAVGLDFFLGADYPYEKYNPGNSNFSNYLTRTFDQAHMPSKIIKPLIADIVGPPSGDKMLDIMLTKGKEWYLLDLFMPDTPDSIKMEMEQKDVDWLEDNELEIWAYLLKENLFYESQWSKIRKFVEYSPEISQMHPEAPGRTANWVGFKIVQAYMKNHPEASLGDLINITDTQRLLDQSRYQPPRRKGE